VVFFGIFVLEDVEVSDATGCRFDGCGFVVDGFEGQDP
jgi:hypothetical protein